MTAVVRTAGELVEHWRSTPSGHADPGAPAGAPHGCRVYFEAPTPAAGKGRTAREARPPRARLCGPIGGLLTVDAAMLYAEAAALFRAAWILEAVEKAWDSTSIDLGRQA